MPPCRKFADGTDFYTLPILTGTDVALGDSFDIASYLQETLPDAGAGDLFPPLELDFPCPGSSLVPLSEHKGNLHADYARFNSNVDMAFSVHAQLMVHMPWDPAVVDEIKAEFVRRAGVATWDDIEIRGMARQELKKSLQDSLRDLATLLQRDTSGPFILGDQACYADIIIGAWLRMLSKAMPEKEWHEVQTQWYDGIFGALHVALQHRFGEVK